MNVISEALGMKLGSCEQGLVVTHIEDNSVADVIGLKPGDIIFKVNFQHTRTYSYIFLRILTYSVLSILLLFTQPEW